MKKILIIWFLISLLLVGGLTFIGINLKSKNKEYYELEDRIRNAAKDYYAQYPNELPINEVIITDEKLIEHNFLNNLNYNNEICRGYVLVKKTYLLHDYIPFIKCSNYNTKNYNEEHEGGN